MKIDVKFDINLRPLKNLKNSLVKKVIRKAMREAGKIVVKAAKQNAKSIKRYGFTAKAVSWKIKSYKTNVISIVGPKSDKVFERGTRIRGKNKGKAIRHRPSFYAHLLERGSKFAKPKPYLAPALKSTAKAYSTAMTQALKKHIAEVLKNSR